MIGQPGFREEIKRHNIRIVNESVEEEESEPQTMSETEYSNFVIDPTVVAVVAGQNFNYTHRKMCKATLYLTHGCELIASNKDRNSGTHERLVPGGGTVIESLEAASGV